MVSIMSMWPESYKSIWDIKYLDYVVEIRWSKNPFEDYKRLAQEYAQCGYLILKDVIESGHNNVKSDMWFFSGIFLMRHSMELGLKALICRVCSNKKEIQMHFKECYHDLSKLFLIYCETGENYLLPAEKKWLIKYLASIEEVDKNSDLFRFPFEDKFLLQYRNKFLDNVAVANNMLQGYHLIKKCIICEKYNHEWRFQSELRPELLIFADHGIGNCHLWEPVSDHGFHTKVKGYIETADFIFSVCEQIPLEERLYPLIFLLRNAIELCLKRLFYAKVEKGVPKHVFSSRRKSHLLKKDLWKNVCPMLQHYGSENNEGLEIIHIVEARIIELDALDKKGDRFRYPTSYSLEYYLNGKKIDVKHVYEYMREVINFFEACDFMLNAASDLEAEMRSYYSDWYNDWYDY